MRFLALIFSLISFLIYGQQVNEMTLVEIPNLNKNLKCLELDNQGYLWIGADEGLFRFNGASLDTINIPLVKDLELTDEGKLLAVSDLGFYQIDPKQDGYEFQLLYSGNSTQVDNSLYFPKKVFIDSKNRTWIGALNDIFSFTDGAFEKYSTNRNQTKASLTTSFLFTEDGFNTIWSISFDGYLMYYDEDFNKFIKVDIPLPLDEILSIESIKNNLYISSGKGLFEITTNKSRAISRVRKISADDKISMLSKKGENLIAASYESIKDPLNQNELFKISSSQIEIIDIIVSQNEYWVLSDEQIFYGREFPALQFPFSTIRSSYSLSKHKDIFISDGKFVKKINSDYTGISDELVYKGGDNAYINSILVKDSLLYFTTSKGVYKRNLFLDKKNDRLYEIEENENLWLNELFLDAKEHIWVFSYNQASLKEGLPSVLEFDKNHIVKEWVDLHKSRFARLNGNGHAYFAGDSSFLAYMINEEIFNISLKFESSQKPEIYDLAFAKDSLLLATEIGLFSLILDNEKVVSLRPLVGGKITSVAIDKEDNAWFCDSKGVNKIVESEIVSITENSGLPSNNVLTRGLLMNGRNELWANTSKGFTKIDMNLLVNKTPKPFIDNIQFDQKKTLNIHSNYIGSFRSDNLLEFKLTTLTFPQNTLTSKLKLYKGGSLYRNLTGNKVISLFGLETGNYELRFQVLQEGMSWSDPVKYELNIVEAWYETILGKIVIILLVGCLVYGIIVLNSRRLKSSNKRLEELVSKRSNELNIQKEKLIESQSKVIQQQKEILENNEVLFETKYALNQSEIKYLGLKKDQLKDELDLKNKQLTTHALSIVRKNQQLLDVIGVLNGAIKKSKSADFSKELSKIRKDIELSMSQDRRWEEFKMYFEQVHTDFNAKLKLSFNDLTPNDLKHCALAKLNMSLEDCAAIMGVSAETVRITRFRIQKKMNLSSQQAFLEFLIGL